MSIPVGQAVARERLRSRLVDLRRVSGLSADEVTSKTHWSASKLHRIEAGVVTVQPTDLQALLTLYEVKDPDEVDHLVDLALVSRRRQWWSGYHLQSEYRDFVAYEGEVSKITVYQALFMPGLLQTTDYARALTASILRKDPGDPDVQRLVDVRARRQQQMFERMRHARPPQLLVLLDGAVLERPVGGVDIMRAQLTRLLEVADQPNVRLGVVPLRYGAHPGLGGVFELLEFAGSVDPDIVFIESTIKKVLVKDREVTAQYRSVAKAIAASGLVEDAALAEVRRVRDAL